MAGIQTLNNPKMQKLMPLLLQLEKDRNDFFPEAVAFGPYHHGEPKLAFVEAFKPIAVGLFILGGPQNKDFYYKKVLDIIGEIRNCYTQSTIDSSITDADLALMMLRDASLIIIFMEISAPGQLDHQLLVKKFFAMKEHLGMIIFEILSRDLLLMENQIPLRVIKLLIDLRYGPSKGDELVNRYMNTSFFGECGLVSQQQPINKEEPLNLLEASHRLLVSQHYVDPAADDEKDNLKSYIPTFRAATDLKAKGIYFKPSPSKSLTDAKFESHLFYAGLQLPQYGVSTRTKVFFKNMVAYELSPNSPAKGEMLSYINLMKSLIERAEDVKELRERRVLYNLLGSDEEVVGVFRDIDTHGSDGLLFRHVNNQIQAHCNSRMKTWMAELLHANFRSPWTIAAFVAAVALLAISAAQLYYAVNPN